LDEGGGFAGDNLATDAAKSMGEGDQFPFPLNLTFSIREKVRLRGEA